MMRKECLEQATHHTVGTPNKHGELGGHFQTIADLWNAYIAGKRFGEGLQPYDVALMLDLMKTARIVTGDPTHDDSWVDKAGYSAIGCELATGPRPDEKPRREMPVPVGYGFSNEREPLEPVPPSRPMPQHWDSTKADWGVCGPLSTSEPLEPVPPSAPPSPPMPQHWDSTKADWGESMGMEPTLKDQQEIEARVGKMKAQARKEVEDRKKEIEDRKEPFVPHTDASPRVEVSVRPGLPTK